MLKLCRLSLDDIRACYNVMLAFKDQNRETNLAENNLSNGGEVARKGIMKVSLRKQGALVVWKQGELSLSKEFYTADMQYHIKQFPFLFCSSSFLKQEEKRTTQR